MGAPIKEVITRHVFGHVSAVRYVQSVHSGMSTTPRHAASYTVIACSP
jgi:hypothetical protein